MEGTHFGAGPWFTVQRIDQDWEVIDHIFLADGETQVPVTVQIKMTLENAK